MSNEVKKELTNLVRELSDAGAHVIAKTEPMDCELCGERKELRPYGPNGEWVCFPCGMKDEEAAKKAFMEQFDGHKHKSGSA